MQRLWLDAAILRAHVRLKDIVPQMAGAGGIIWFCRNMIFFRHVFTCSAHRSHPDRGARRMRIRSERILWLAPRNERDRETAGLARSRRLLVRVRLAAVAHRSGTQFSARQESASGLRGVSS